MLEYKRLFFILKVMALINMPAEPQLWDKEKLEADNSAYALECLAAEQDWKTETMQEESQDLLWGSFSMNQLNKVNEIKALEAADDQGWDILYDEWSNNDRNEEKETSDNEEKLRIFRENTQAPLIESLLNQWYITSLEFDWIVEEINWVDKESINQIISSVTNSIEDKDIREEITSHLEWKQEQVTLENFENSNFYLSSNELWVDIDVWIWGLELMLANEFYILPNSEWISDQSGDMLRTMDTVSKMIVNKNNKDFRKNNSDLIREIWEETVSSVKYALLKKLFKEDLVTDAKFWGKKAKNEIAMKQKSIKEKAKLNTESMEKLATLQGNEDWNKEKEKLIEDKNELIIAAQNLDHFEWEVFAWNMKIEWEKWWSESSGENS